LAFNNSSVRVTGRMTFEALLFSGATTLVLKSVIGRSRPYTNEGTHKFNWFQFVNNDNQSLPSGHTTVAFAVSSVLAARIQNVFATIGLYGLAALTAGARIYEDQHWLSDTFLGAAIGGFIGNAVAHLHDGDTSGGTFWNLTPTISPNLNGMTLTYHILTNISDVR
jgi:membrane-associated phospholipid phosphatase